MVQYDHIHGYSSMTDAPTIIIPYSEKFLKGLVFENFENSEALFSK